MYGCLEALWLLDIACNIAVRITKDFMQLAIQYHYSSHTVFQFWKFWFNSSTFILRLNFMRNITLDIWSTFSLDMDYSVALSKKQQINKHAIVINSS